MALNGLLYVDMPLRTYSVTQSLSCSLLKSGHMQLNNVKDKMDNIQNWKESINNNICITWMVKLC